MNDNNQNEINEQTQQQLLNQTDETLETNITISEQNITIATDLLQSMKEANESLQRTTEKLIEMENTLKSDDQMVEQNYQRSKCNLIFYVLLGIGFLIMGIIALCKFYFKIDFFN